MSMPSRIPESNVTGTEPAASTAAARPSIAGTPPFAWRPPWLE
ncbi:Uncharacterised protein [Mycobacteroides abscessus subsp. abscessus]|nr:Uncharacterised protein [Mycobacteroides abscessus subsp. abscessus]